ncbi:hypothetical protein NZD88_00425 [Chryseobacterium antibioticum]|uniref:YD repeat-containing protein n=1 Tax=Chryseobacterium pyrolae TaxID=2987481 RepID=A0ABT2IBK5_9FLAO|nr:hypothetical protein [Chryseobacterium pyrolae]MCT2406015.1 hypothetical protein [Chryseobacterium pyrolae]
MKKYFLLGLMSSATILTNCSSDDDSINNPAEQKLLLSKITTVYYDNPSNPETSVATFEYNNQGELMKMLSEGRASVFEYNSGKPTKISYYTPSQTLEYYTVFNYSGDQLVNTKAIYTNPDFNRKSTYTYNSNGKLISSTLCQSEDCSNPSTSTYAYNGDNISTETSTIGGSIISAYKREFSHDDKLNPFTYMNKYLKIMMERAYSGNKNNYITERLSYKNNDGSWTQNQNITYTIQYNSAQLPVQVVGKETNGNNYVQYNYEYITQ